MREFVFFPQQLDQIKRNFSLLCHWHSVWTNFRSHSVTHISRYCIVWSCAHINIVFDNHLCSVVLSAMRFIRFGFCNTFFITCHQGKRKHKNVILFRNFAYFYAIFVLRSQSNTQQPLNVHHCVVAHPFLHTVDHPVVCAHTNKYDILESSFHTLFWSVFWRQWLLCVVTEILSVYICLRSFHVLRSSVDFVFNKFSASLERSLTTLVWDYQMLVLNPQLKHLSILVTFRDWEMPLSLFVSQTQKCWRFIQQETWLKFH